MEPALRFLADTAFGILTYSFLLRFMMQMLRAPFRNPLGPALLALTDWAVKPVRRVVPGLRGVDWTTLLLAWLTQWIWLVVIAAISGAGASGPVLAITAVLAVIELIKAAIWILIIAVIVQALLSWIAPDGPLSGLLNALTFRFLAPLRRRIPPLGGTLDLSPLIFIVLAQLVLMLPVRWLEGAVLQSMRVAFPL
jgi:YggT family protein